MLFLHLRFLTHFLAGDRVSRREQNVRGAHRFRALELLSVLVIKLLELFVGNVDLASQFAVHDLLANGAFQHLGVELFGGKIHRAELPLKGLV